VLKIDVRSGTTAVRFDRYLKPRWKVDRCRRLLLIPVWRGASTGHER
jgi:hypothetical protein